MKGRRPHEVPMVEDVGEVFDGVAAATGGADASPWVLASDNPERPVAPTSKGWRRLLMGGGIIENEADDGADQAEGEQEGEGWKALPIRFHDLRRTVRDRLADLGVALPVAEALIGHAPPKLVRTYKPGGVALRERRRALEKWARELRRVVHRERAKVVKIRS
jgi:integrase